MRTIPMRTIPPPLPMTRDEEERLVADIVRPFVYGVTGLCVFWNGVVTWGCFSTIWPTVRALSVTQFPKPMQEDLFFQVMLTILLVGLPILGGYVSYMKGRTLVEGYILTTFFGPLGLLVALLLPTKGV